MVTHFHGKQYNYLEPDLCNLAILQDVVIEDNQRSKKETKMFLQAQECLFQDDIEQSNCPICLENIFEDE